jgi:glycogen synthase
MRVLMTTDTVGGVWTYAIQLAKSLSRYDVMVDLVTLGPAPEESQRQEALALPNVALHEVSCRLEWMDDPWDDLLSAGERLLRLAEELQPDVIHLNDYSQGALPWSAPVLVVGHSCVLSWHRAVRGTPAGAEWDVYRDHVAEGLRGADLVVAPTAAMLESLQSHYGPLSHTEVISNGRDLMSPHPRSSAGHAYVFTAGRLWDEAKNVSVLDAAAGEIAWPVYAAGDLNSPNGGRASSSALHLIGRVSPAEMKRRLQEAAIYAHPARYEPFGLVPLEAAQCGCALVLGDIPTLREIWKDSALFVSPDDAAGLAVAINRLIADPRLRQRYAERARSRAGLFTADQMAQRYLRAYRALIGDCAGPFRQHREGFSIRENGVCSSI